MSDNAICDERRNEAARVLLDLQRAAFQTAPPIPITQNATIHHRTCSTPFFALTQPRCVYQLPSTRINGNTSLMDAVQGGDMARATQLLQDARDNVLMAQNNSGDTALHMACQRGDLSMVKYLLRSTKRMLVNICNLKLETCAFLFSLCQHTIDTHPYRPLHVAAQANDFLIVPVLLYYGADANAKNYNEETPLHLAIQNCRPETEARCYSVVEGLLRHGASRTAKTTSGYTVLALSLVKAYSTVASLVFSFRQEDQPRPFSYFPTTPQKPTTTTTSSPDALSFHLCMDGRIMPDVRPCCDHADDDDDDDAHSIDLDESPN